jgi:hypothetical protein
MSQCEKCREHFEDAEECATHLLVAHRWRFTKAMAWLKEQIEREHDAAEANRPYCCEECEYWTKEEAMRR